VFYVAVLPVVLIPFILKSMPDSIGFMLKQGRQDELKIIARRLRPDLVITDDTQLVGNPQIISAQDKPVQAFSWKAVDTARS
jgi:AAHS family benzoate transporter-like MFS transporter